MAGCYELPAPPPDLAPPAPAMPGRLHGSAGLLSDDLHGRRSSLRQVRQSLENKPDAGAGRRGENGRMNYDHPPSCILITGKKGSGKTTYWLARIIAKTLAPYPVNARSSASGRGARWIFVFDPCREVSRKLLWPVSIDVPRMVRNFTTSGIVCFDSSHLFPGDRLRGFAFFSRWAFNVCKGLNGPKLFAADELQSCQATGPHGMPQGFKEILDEGRREEIDCLFAAQRINEVNDDVRGHLTELITFKHDDPLPLEWLEKRGFDPEAVRALPSPGAWIRRTDDGQITTNARIHRPRKADRASPVVR